MKKSTKEVVSLGTVIGTTRKRRGNHPVITRYVQVFCMVVMTLLSVGNVWGADAELNSVSTKNVATTDGGSVSLTFGGVTCTITKNSGNQPGFYTSSGIVRYYSGDVMKLSVESATISKIVFVMSSGTVGTASVGSLSDDKKTWTGSASSVSFTGGGTVKITSITVTYSGGSSTEPRTVTFNAGGGTCGTGSLKEASAGAGVTLPTATPSAACSGADPAWTFAGWAKASCAETTTKPTLYAAGETYKPSDDETLYAVYKQTGEGSGFSKYEKVTTAPSDWSGKYLISNGSSTATGSLLPATGTATALAITTFTPGTTEKTEYEFTISKNGTNDNYYIILPDGTTYAGGKSSGADMQFTSSPSSGNYYLWTFSTSDPMTKNVGNSRYIGVGTQSSTDVFKAYSTSGTNAKCYLYKRIEGGGTTTYNSTPDCCTPLGQINGSLNLTQVDATSVKVDWSGASNFSTLSSASDATGWKVFVYNDNNGVKGTLAKSVDINNKETSSTTVTELTSGKTYWFTVAVTTDGTNYCEVGTESEAANIALSEPTITATGGQWVTSTKEKKVKVIVPVTAKGFLSATTLTATVTGDGFSVLGWGTNGNSVSAGAQLTTSVILQYQPTAYNTTTDATLTITGSGATDAAVTVHGRSLPEKFVMVTKTNNDSKWWAVPANMTGANTYAGVEVTVDNSTTPTKVTAGPASALYALTEVSSSNFADYGTAVRLYATETNKMLWGTDTDDGTGINNNAVYTGTSTDHGYEWILTTMDGAVYSLQNVAYNIKDGHTAGTRQLRYYNGESRYGMYTTGNSSFRFLPVDCATRATVSDVAVTHNTATLTWSGAAAAAYNLIVKQGNTTVSTLNGVTSPTVVSGLSGSTTYTYILTPGEESDGCALSGTFTTAVAPIAITLSCDGKTYNLGEQSNPYTLPTSGQYTDDACEEWKFIGWSASAVAAGESYTLITEATTSGTYYAVYSGTRDNASTTYERATALSQLTEGMAIVIAYKGNSNILTSAITTGTTQTETNSKISVPDDTYKWVLSKSGDNWILTNKSTSTTLGASATTSQTPVSLSSSNNVWSIEQLSASGYENTFIFGNAAASGVYLQCYNSKWQIYSTTNDNNRAFYVYIPAATVSTTSDCCSEVTAPDVSVNVRTTGATLSWNAQAGATNGYNVVINEASINEDLAAEATEYVAQNLTENTTYTYTVTAKGATCSRSTSGEFTTNEYSITVAEWDTAAVYLDLGDMVSATAIVENQNTQADVTQNFAQDIFFSKYFEASGFTKLVGIFNGTDHAIDISDLKIIGGSASGAWVTSQYNYVTLAKIQKLKDDYGSDGKIMLPMNTEIIFYSVQDGNQAGYSADGCLTDYSWKDLADNTIENWYRIGLTASTGSVVDSDGHYPLNFSGNNSIGLWRGSELIDIIGGGTSSKPLVGNVTNTSKHTLGNGREISTPNDKPGFFCEDGMSPAAEGYPNGYSTYLTTNRCLLIRSTDVVSGANAVASNTTDFNTLCTEWIGIPVGNDGTSAERDCLSGQSFGYVGGFDYNTYYAKYDTINDGMDLTDYRQPDGTYKIEISQLDTMSCTNLRIVVQDKSTGNTVSGTWKVPIFVTADKAEVTTSDEVFTKEGDDCAECDVVVLRKATLKSVDGGKNTVRNIEVYPGATLTVPSSTEFNVNRLIMRSKDDTTSCANIQGTLNQTATQFALDKRIKTGRWYWIALPYRCKISDVTWRSGELATYGTDWMLKYYDGDQRANGSQGSNWKQYTGEYMEPGVGYILNFNSDVLEKGNQYAELRFPMTANTGFSNSSSVSVPVKAYGAANSRKDANDEPIRPNHLGWNLIGNPYLNTYTKGNLPNALPQGLLVEDPAAPGKWKRESDNLRYVVVPNNGGYSAYSQIAIGDRDLEPFMAYFVQIDGTEDNQELNVVFSESNVKRSPLRRAPSEIDDQHPVWVALALKNPRGEQDETTLLVSDQFTDGYDMMDDMLKWRGDYYKYTQITTRPVLATRNSEGEMAFNALPDASALAGVPLHFYAAEEGDYTLSLQGKYNIDEVQMAYLWDATTSSWHDLLAADYTFHTARTDDRSRFTLSIKLQRKAPSITTTLPTAPADLTLRVAEQTLVLSGVADNAAVYVYDMTGKLVDQSSSGSIRRTRVPESGVYNVRVITSEESHTLRAIVK